MVCLFSKRNTLLTFLRHNINVRPYGIFQLFEQTFISLQDQDTPLHVAASYGHHKVCNMLLKSGADVHSKGQASIKYFATRLYKIKIKNSQ